MRKFYFENQIGDRINLNNEDGIFLYEPSGLGLEYENEYGKSESGFFMRIKDEIAQNATEFTLVFPPNEYCESQYEPYERYRRLIDWIYSATELYFVYCPYGTYEYYKKVDIETIEKSELDKYGSLRPKVSILPLTPWYLPAPININFGGDDDEHVMRHTFTYDEYLHYGVGTSAYAADITMKGHIPSAVKITFQGQVINPSVTLRGSVSRTVYGKCSITGEFHQDDTFILSTAEQNSYVKKIDSQGVETDLLDSIDITTNPFFRVPTSEPCEISIAGDSIYGKASMLLYVYYRGV